MTAGEKRERERMTGAAILKRWPPADYQYITPTGQVASDPASLISGRCLYWAKGGRETAEMKRFYNDFRPAFTMRLKGEGQ